MALDVGCGTGQSTVVLAEIAERIIGIDPSADMLRAATPHPKVEYREAAAEHTPFSDGQFDLASGVAIASDGGVWVSDWGNNRIHHFDASGEWIASWGEVGDEEGEIDNPAGVAVDSQNRVYIADQDNTRVQAFTADGQFLSAIGENGIDAAEFSWMTGIAAGPDDVVYVIDTDQHSIQAFQMKES